MKITLATPSVCPELYSCMNFLGLSLHKITFLVLYTVCQLPTFTIPDCKIDGQSNHTSSMINIPKAYF